MDHRIPKAGVVIALVCAAAAIASFIFLNLAFEGPSLIKNVGGKPYTLEATFKDTEILPTKQPVLLRGLEVGKVKNVAYNHDSATATVRFSVKEEYAPIHKNAHVWIGERTILGDPYLALEPGSESAGELKTGAKVEARDSVDFDEAFEFLDEEGRTRVKSILGELKDATRAKAGPERLNATVGGLTRTVRELRGLTDSLRGQEEDLAGLARDGAIVLGELGRRERALRTIVGSGRQTLGAFADNAGSLDRGLAEVPGVLDASRRVLAESRPLLRAARPAISDLADAAPLLTPILADLPAITTDTVDIVSRLSGVPTFRELLTVVKLVGPSVPAIEGVARNLVPLLAYTADRSPGLAAFFANLAGATQSGDANGHWLRTAAVFQGNLSSDTPASGCPQRDLCFNAYPGPADARDPQPYPPGSYPRLQPFKRR